MSFTLLPSDFFRRLFKTISREVEGRKRSYYKLPRELQDGPNIYIYIYVGDKKEGKRNNSTPSKKEEKSFSLP